MKGPDIMFVKLYKLRCGIIFLFLCGNTAIAQSRNLDFYINEGLTNSPLLKDYQNQVAANLIDSQRLKATLRPQVTATSNNNISPIINGYGYDAALTNQQSFTELINVNQTFIGRNNLSTQYRGMRLVNDTIRNGLKLSEQDLRRTIIAQYITAYGDLQQLNFHLEVNNILKNQEIILKKLAQNNVYRQTDYLTFLVTMKQQELQMKQLRIQYRNDYATLNYLCGIFDTSNAALDPPDITLQYLPDRSSSAFFMRYKIDSIRLANEMTILKYTYRPKLTAYVNAGYSSTLLYQAYKNFGAGAGINLNVPIYDGHQRALQEKKIHLLENTNLNYKDFFTRQYDQQTAMLRQQLAATEALINDINEQIKFAEGLINVNGKLLETGDAKIVDFVIAINNFLTAKNLLAQNNISRMQVINQLNYWNR
jgi:outer membrane protein TolC